MVSEASQQRPWVVGAAVSVAAFLVLGSYGLVRAPVDGRFLTDYGHETLPWVWVAVAVTVFVVVGIYGRVADRVHLHTLLIGAALTAATVLAAIRGLAGDSHATGFLLYVWKDVYVVVLVEILWSIANAVMRVEIARWVYGLFCAAGSIGGFAGNVVASRLSAAGDADMALNVVFAVFAAIALLGMAAPRWLGRIRRPQKDRDASGALQVLLKSRYLLLLLATVCAAQVATTLIDYVYSAVVESSFHGVNERSRALADVNKIIDSLSLVLQLLTGVVLRFAGIATVLLGIPLLIGGSLASVLAIPSFTAAAALKVANKCLDYSLYRSAKELLYLPLSYQQKLKGKAVIDVFGYRVAKGGASLVLLAAIGFKGAAVAAMVVCGFWFLVVRALLARYRQRSAASADPPDSL